MFHTFKVKARHDLGVVNIYINAPNAESAKRSVMTTERCPECSILSVEQVPYLVKYTYDQPSGAGPFKGKMETRDPYAKGETIAATFGRATVVSCRVLKK
jgi:hypothetical protein